MYLKKKTNADKEEFLAQGPLWYLLQQYTPTASLASTKSKNNPITSAISSPPKRKSNNITKVKLVLPAIGSPRGQGKYSLSMN